MWFFMKKVIEGILENIQLKIDNKPCKRYALEGEKRLELLMEAYTKAVPTYAGQALLNYIYKGHINSKQEFLTTILGERVSNNIDWKGLVKLIKNDQTLHLVFVEDYDDLITRIDTEEDSRYALSEKLVKMKNLYLTITSSGNPETIKVFLPNSPYDLHSYFSFVDLDKTL